MALTADAFQHDKTRAFEAGHCQFVTKPFSTASLLIELKRGFQAALWKTERARQSVNQLITAHADAFTVNNRQQTQNLEREGWCRRCCHNFVTDDAG